MKKPTGLVDKNGVPISEGDTLHSYVTRSDFKVIINKGGDFDVQSEKGTISLTERVLDVWDMEVK